MEIQDKERIEDRIRAYWTGRAADFGEVRSRELQNDMGERWKEELLKLLPHKRDLKILDVGTGTGYFCILLAEQGFQMTGIDLTPAMITEAKRQAGRKHLDIDFRVMDAEQPDFPEETFDAVISRNLTWTLPDVEQAYQGWKRVLKTGGVLLNFDANYGAGLRNQVQSPAETAPVPYGHQKITKAQKKENDEITLSMEISHEQRPAWDIRYLESIGFTECQADLTVDERLMGANATPGAPLFGIRAVKK